MLLVLFNKFLGKRNSGGQSDAGHSTLEETIQQIQKGNLRLRNQFISDYQPYVAKVASRFCKRYIDPARDDEFSIALGAFNEAIDQYSVEKGRSFLVLAETIIRRRLIDFLRKEQRFHGQIPYSAFDQEDDEDNFMNPIEVHQALEAYEQQKGLEERRSEIADFSRRLDDFGIAFSELTTASPKHDDSRQMMFSIGRILAEDAELMRTLLTKRQLPIKELLEQIQVSRKTLERNRKYLIAVALIYSGSYPYLRDYLHIRVDD